MREDWKKKTDDEAAMLWILEWWRKIAWNNTVNRDEEENVWWTRRLQQRWERGRDSGFRDLVFMTGSVFLFLNHAGQSRFKKFS